MSLSRPRDRNWEDGGDEGLSWAPPAKRTRGCCGCCQQMELFKEILESMSREIGATRDFYERQVELLQKEMRCMSQGQKEALESIRREMQGLYQTINTNFRETSEHNQRNWHSCVEDRSRSGGYVQQSFGPGKSSDQNCITMFRLQFENSCSDVKYSTHEIKADDGNQLKVAIYDHKNEIITYEPFSSMRVCIVAIDGEFDKDQKGHWTEDHFRNNIVVGRPKHKQLLFGTLYFKLQNGVGYLNDAIFQDSCCFVPSKTLKLAVMADDERITERIQEGITESFPVRDGRGYSTKKNPHPSPGDPVHKLKQIGMNGHRHKLLESNGVKTVEDFLCAYREDDKKLRKILGNISDHDWDIIVKHAHKCNPRKETRSSRIQEKNIADQHEPIFRNSDSYYLRGSCLVQPSHTVQASFHEQIIVQDMHQHVSSIYNGLSSAVPPENLPSEFSLQPNTSCQHMMPQEYNGAIQVTNQQISSTGNEFQSAHTHQRSTSLEPDSLYCNIEHDGNKLPSGSSAENTLDDSTSLQADPPKHGTTRNDATRHRPSATIAARPQHRRLRIATTVATAVVIWKKKVAESPRFFLCTRGPRSGLLRSSCSCRTCWICRNLSSLLKSLGPTLPCFPFRLFRLYCFFPG